MEKKIMVLRLNRMEPEGDKCPEGYEYVHGHRETSGKYVRSFCRKIPKKRIKVSLDMKYPGNTDMKLSARQGIHRASVHENISTESLFSGESGEKIKQFMKSDWKKMNDLESLADRRKKKDGE